MAFFDIILRDGTVLALEAATYVLPSGEWPLAHVRFYKDNPDEMAIVKHPDLPIYSVATCDVVSISMAE